MSRWRLNGWRDFSLQRRLTLTLTGFCLLIAGLFSLYALAFAYTVEDQFFTAMLEDEAQRQRSAHQRLGAWQPTSNPDVRLYASSSQFPADLIDSFRAQPQRREFAGTQGRHYHLLQMLDPGQKSAWLVAEVSQKLVFRQMRGTVFDILLYSTLALLLLALLLAWWLAHSAALPVTALARTIAALKPDQLPAQLPANDSRAEVGVLTRGLNDLIERLRQFVEREQTFTRDVSHELRTPLSVIRCAAEQVAALPALAPAAKPHLELILSATTQLQQTITTLLTIARETHCRELRDAPCRLLPLLERVVIEQSPLLAGKNVALDLRIDSIAQSPLPEAILHILLSNLIGNAFAHCNPDSRVEIYLAQDRLHVVNQSGHEIDNAAAASAFAKHPDSTGFGLGLSITQRLCDRFGLNLRFDLAGPSARASFALLERGQVLY